VDGAAPRRVRRIAGDEHGAIFVMSALILLVMIGFASLVLDIGLLRWDKRTSQTAADMATVAGAMSLPLEGEGSGLAACQTAWAYVLENTLIEDDGTDPCLDALDAGSFNNVCETEEELGDVVANEVERTVGPYVVRIAWPVPDGSEYLLGLSGEDDGHPCERIAVQIERQRGFFFAGGIFGLGEGFTTTPAVARATVGFNDVDVSSLVVLDPVGCQTPNTSGPLDLRGSAGSGVFVHENPNGGPGIITVDSDGSTCADSNNRRLFHFAGTNAQIKAGVFGYAGSQGRVRRGIIFSYALQQGRPKAALWESTRVPSPTSVDSAGQLVGGHPAPREPVAGPRFTRAPVVHRYDCRSGYGTGTPSRPHVAIDDCPGSESVPENSQYLTNLRNSVAGTPPAGFTVHTGSACSIGTDLTLPPGDHWFACTLSVSSNRTLTIPAGNVVVTGGVDVQGTLIVNTSDEDHWFVIRNGDLDRGGSSSLDLGNEDGGVFVYLQNGRINTQGGGDQTSWIAPHAGPFEDLALWSDSPDTHEMLGSSALSLEGVFYIPNASFSFGGGGTMTQQDAQFIVYRFHTHGGGALRMVPNPERNIGDPRLSVALIR
jgi:hypothetical protein